MKSMLAYATSIGERVDPLLRYYDGEAEDDNLSEWLSRKSLCNEELFDLSLQEKKISRKQFNLAIKELNEKDIEILIKENKDASWYQKALDIFGDEQVYREVPNDIDFSFAFRPYIYYLKNQMEKVVVNDISICDAEAFIIHLAEEFLQISSKTLVYDLHEQKKNNIFEGETPNERFVYYMKQRFGNKTSMLGFYEEYPVLFRVLTERTLFHIDNYKAFVQAIQQSLPKFESVFSLVAPYQVSGISVGAGDSHGKGKTVILFQMNGESFVFKYKNLEIGERFNDFLIYLEKETGKRFFKIKRIVEQNYCIEEFVPRQECKTEEAVKKFYRRFGEYVALAYLLCGNDFHYENLIAHSEFPVLIDIETLIQNDSPIKFSSSPFVELSIKKFSSVLGSALLPMRFYENRIEPQVKGMAGGFRISAFDGNKQMSPYKTLGLTNINTDEVKFEYVEYELEGSNNIPVLKGKEVDSTKYKSQVIKGFEEVCEYFMNNTNKVISIIEEIFSDVLVRNVIKGTQKYVDMLEYGYHPKCMKNYIEREKLFENLWAFDYENKSVILPEIRDLLVNDVPIFFNNTSKRSLITSDGKILKNYYNRTAIERVREKILYFDDKEYKYQKLRLMLSLGIYEQQAEVIDLGGSTEEVLHRIAEIICSRAKYNEKKSSVTFEDFVDELDGSLDYNALNAEFYDGLSGIYLFVLFYTKRYSNPDVEILKSALEKTLFRLPGKKQKKIQLNAYTGKYSILYPLYHKYKFEQSEKSLSLAENIIADLDKDIDENAGADWLNGVSGLIQVLINYYQLTKKSYFLEKAELLANILDKKRIEFCGFAHGLSGVIHVSYSLYCETGRQKYLDRIGEYLQAENQHFNDGIWADLREGKNMVSQWCHGTVGIGLSRLYLLKKGFSDEEVRRDLYRCINDVLATQVEESGVCHGDIGRFLFLKEVQQAEFLPQDIKKKVNIKTVDILQNIFDNGVVVKAFEGQSVLGLMTGIAGVGYGLLKELNMSIPNILVLE